jgi:hypothetical protein
MNGTRLPAPRVNRFTGWSLMMPLLPSRTGLKGNSSIAIPAFMPATRSDELADRRQENVLSGDSVGAVHGFVLFAKSIQEGIARFALKMGSVDPNPDWKIYANSPRMRRGRR